MAKVKDLPKVFIGSGYLKGHIFTQIKRNVYGYIYLVSTGKKIYFEVFEKVINQRFNCVSYPTDKEFGKWAWTTHSIDQAYKILKNKLEVPF